jgi:hypothetical protein
MATDKFPLTLDDLLTVLAARGLLQHLSIGATTDGKFQASYKRPGTSAYTVSIKDDVVEAVRGALHPGWGLPWSGILGPQFAEVFGELDDEDDIMGPAKVPADDDDEVEDIL